MEKLKSTRNKYITLSPLLENMIGKILIFRQPQMTGKSLNKTTKLLAFTFCLYHTWLKQ